MAEVHRPRGGEYDDRTYEPLLSRYSQDSAAPLMLTRQATESSLLEGANSEASFARLDTTTINREPPRAGLSDVQIVERVIAIIGPSKALLQKFRESMTNAHWLVARGDEQRLADLLRSKSNSVVNATKRPLKITLLHVAAIMGHENVVRLLISSGASVDSKDALKRTPLHWSSLAAPSRIPQLLVEAGAKVDQLDETKESTLHLAAKSGNSMAAELLLQQGVPIEGRDDVKMTPLHIAASSGNANVAQILLERGANINATDGWGRTALHWAAYGGKLAVGTLLLDSGAGINLQDPRGKTPLHEACFWGPGSGRESFIALLLARGADTTIVSRDGYEPTKLAMKWRSQDFMKLFEGY